MILCADDSTRKVRVHEMTTTNIIQNEKGFSEKTRTVFIILSHFVVLLHNIGDNNTLSILNELLLQ